MIGEESPVVIFTDKERLALEVAGARYRLSVAHLAAARDAYVDCQLEESKAFDDWARLERNNPAEIRAHAALRLAEGGL